MDGYADNRDRSHDSKLLIQEGLMAAVVTIVIIPVIVKGLSKMDGLAMAAAMKLQKDDKTEKYKKETSADRKRNGAAEVFLYIRTSNLL